MMGALCARGPARSGPPLCPYAPECVEGLFPEVELPCYGVLGSSLAELQECDHTAQEVRENVGCR